MTYSEKLLDSSVTQLTKLNVETIAQLEKNSIKRRTFGEKAADLVASGIGSWIFIAIQSTVLCVWIIFNLLHTATGFDPYPFILLNLALSFQAAYSSPIIMMSQNRQAKLTERRSHLDLQVNLLTEQESTEIIKLLQKLCHAHGIDPGAESQALAQSTQADKVLEQIQEFVEDGHRIKANIKTAS